MDFDLLRSWLGLPPGPWPPDHYALLGFPPGRADPALVEPRVLERMDLLRRHQLLHPELVTEGMNRLAQALITLTDPAGKAAHDATLGVNPDSQPATTPAPAQPDAAAVEPLPQVPVFADEASGTDATQPLEVRWPASGEGPPLPAGVKVVSWEEVLPIPAYEVVPDSEARPAAPLELPPAVVDGVVVGAPAGPKSRRWLYARLALLRRALRAWDRLRPVLADPQDPVDRPARVLLLVEAVREVRPLLPRLAGLVGGLGEPGGLVAAVVNQALLLDTFRRLLPDQRQAVAIDWRRGEAALQAEYARLRRLARAGRYRVAGTPAGLTLLRWAVRTPELLLLVLGALAVLVALVRGMGRP